jgi:hypothetical protein
MGVCRYKSVKWWLQCFLAGIETIVVGFRDDHGVVHTVDQMRVANLPKQARHTLENYVSVLLLMYFLSLLVQDSVPPWSPNACFHFLLAFIEFVTNWSTFNETVTP